MGILTRTSVNKKNAQLLWYNKINCSIGEQNKFFELIYKIKKCCEK